MVIVLLVVRSHKFQMKEWSDHPWHFGSSDVTPFGASLAHCCAGCWLAYCLNHPPTLSLGAGPRAFADALCAGAWWFLASGLGVLMPLGLSGWRSSGVCRLTLPSIPASPGGPLTCHRVRARRSGDVRDDVTHRIS